MTTMKTKTLAFLLTVAFGCSTALVPTTAQAQTAEASGLATAQVYSTSLQVQHRSDLSFGTVVAGNNAQNVTKQPDNGGQDVASFRVTGSPTASVLLSITTDDLVDDQGNTLAYTPDVTGNAFDNQGSSESISLNDEVDLNQAGDYFIWIGGTITVGAGQAPGAYESTIIVGAEYF
jgi:hypothetical protein